MICTEDEEFYPVGHEWNFQGCNVKLLEVSHNGTYTIVCDITVDDQTYPEQMLQDGTTYTYGAYTVTCRGFIGTDDGTTLAQATICAEPEANKILTLYFRPWPWTNINSVLSNLAKKTIEIQGAIANVFSNYTGYEYISHEITKETLEGRTREYIAVHIYINDTSDASSIQFISDTLAIELGIAIVVVVLALGIVVGWKLKSAKDSKTIIALEQEVAELTKTVNEQTMEKDGDAFVNGETSDEEYIGILHDAIRKNKETANLLHLDSSTFNEYEQCVNNAIDTYQSSGKTQADKISLRESRDACENTFASLMTDEVNARKPEPFLPDVGTNEWQTYLMYGGMAVGGIILVTLGIQFIDTINIKR